MSKYTVHGTFNINTYTIISNNHSNDATPHVPFQHTGHSNWVIYHPYLRHNPFYSLKLGNKFNHETNLKKRKYFRAAKFNHYTMKHSRLPPPYTNSIFCYFFLHKQICNVKTINYCISIAKPIFIKLH